MAKRPQNKQKATKDHPVPYDDSDEKAASFEDEVTIAANTAEALEAMGAPLEMSKEDVSEAERLIEEAVKNKKAKSLQKYPVATAMSGFLKTYGSAVAMDVIEARNAITGKLFEIANCGDTKYELKALELLGKHSDIGLFSNKSEITVKYDSPDDLEKAIKERVKRLLSSQQDDRPDTLDLDEELGIGSAKDVVDAEYTEVTDWEGGDLAAAREEKERRLDEEAGVTPEEAARKVENGPE